ncbi:lysophospholipid acyltransferase family protein [Thermodesulfobacteriota bacterium]
MAIFLPERNSAAVRSVRFAARTLFCPFFNIHVSGTQNIPAGDPFILLPKHQRWEDIPIVAISTGLPLYYVAKQELFNNIFSRNIISMLGGLPVNRRQPARSRNTYSKIMEKLTENEGIVIFPEGTYYKNRMGTGHIGLVRMIHSNMDTLFVPAGINYRRGSTRTNVLVSFGKPIKGKDYENSSELLNSIMTDISRLSGL